MRSGRGSLARLMSPVEALRDTLAIGTGLNAAKGFDAAAIAILADRKSVV